MQKRQIVTWYSLFPEALQLLIKNDPLRLAGATAFFTTFALPAILIIILQISGIFIDARKSDLQLFEKLSRFVGRQTSLQLINTLHAFKGLANSLLITVTGFVFLLFVATTLFKVIRDSLNQIWDIPKASRHKFSHTVSSRFRSLLLIVFAGLLFLVTILIEGFQTMVNTEIKSNSVLVGLILNGTIAYLISIIVVTTWFALIFYFLPDAKPSWRIGVIGAGVTAVLFTFGKFILRWLLLHSNINSIFGTSVSIVLLLLFVFYSSMIFYFGAAFTRVLAAHMNHPIDTIRKRK